ncbi:hypothetical protein PACTADRAFT_75010 [Pachysolen tannophilus NRRL Y-2460]|uniref:Amino acid permease/ SLC12A domain-containing protein n=1 Tax=Pachysolen tannophilus NRRL Y-2460 TaxID=669874 RepID=A0A1E4TVH6_PACTA|nr:hypothetical protein PACTADRAFT_75010 [Pachysolen tannophilus NRRL Y-2460]
MSGSSSSGPRLARQNSIELKDIASKSTGFSKKSDFLGENTLLRSVGTSSKNDGSDYEDGDYEELKVRRGLKARHLSMIALGGTIGTGLFVGISTPLQDSGPVNSLIAYIFMGSLVYMIIQALGEMSTYIPVAGSFTVYNTRFLSRPLGAANGWLYFYNWAVTFAVEVSVIPDIIEYWTDAVPVAAWVSIFLVVITLANLFPVRYYGEIEFWVAAIKVIAIVGWLIYALCMVCGAGKEGPIGFRYWRNPGPWGPGLLVESHSTGRFLGWVSSLINAAFTYQGTETVSIASGEVSNPTKSIPKSINKVIFRILFFYILSLFFVGLLVPYDDPAFSSDGSYTSASPFIIAMVNCGTPILPHIFNAVILTTVISAGNSDVYLGSRVLYGLAESGIAPKFFTKCSKQGVPYISVFFTAIFGCLAYLSVSNGGTTAFNWLVNISTLAGLVAWAFIPICHIRFTQALKHRGISKDVLPFKANFMPWGDYYALFFIVLITFVQGYAVFFDFNASDFFVNYISLILFFVFWIIFQIYYRETRIYIPIEEVDIDSDRAQMEGIVWENDEDDEPKNLWEKFWSLIS